MLLTDIHSHILPGVDDGAMTMEDALDMLKIAQKNGIGKTILTPHYSVSRKNHSREHIEKEYKHLVDECRKQGITIELFLGNEVHYAKDIATELDNNKIILMANSNAILLEFSPTEEFQYIKDAVQTVMCYDLNVIVAHVERYECLFRSNDKITELKRYGVFFQVNASSITGETGKTYKKRAKDLLKRHMIDFIATDAHNCKSRTPNLSECAKLVKKKYGEEYYERIFFRNPQELLENKLIVGE